MERKEKGRAKTSKIVVVTKGPLISSQILPETVFSIAKIVVLLLKHFYNTCFEEVSTVLQRLLGVLIIFQGSLKENPSPESLYGKIAGFFFVIISDNFLIIEAWLVKTF